jgi:hypothetical protein
MHSLNCQVNNHLFSQKYSMRKFNLSSLLLFRAVVDVDICYCINKYLLANNLKLIILPATIMLIMGYIPICLGETWVDKDGKMDVSIDYETITIRDYNNFEYFDYIYGQITNDAFNDENIFQLRIGFDVTDNIATDFIPSSSVEAYEEHGLKVIKIETYGSIFAINAFQFLLDQGMRLELSVSDKNFYFSVLLSKWHELQLDTLASNITPNSFTK